MDSNLISAISKEARSGIITKRVDIFHTYKKEICTLIFISFDGNYRVMHDYFNNLHNEYEITYDIKILIDGNNIKVGNFMKWYDGDLFSNELKDKLFKVDRGESSIEKIHIDQIINVYRSVN